METKEQMSGIAAALQTVARLRDPEGGCPWDLKQTFFSLRKFLVEETYEVLELLDQLEKDDLTEQPEVAAKLEEEFGDLLLQILLHAQMASEKGLFDFQSIAKKLSDKLITRHPHVFAKSSDTSVKTEADVLKAWGDQKAAEKKSAGETSVIASVMKSGPALLRAQKLIEAVTRVGFQWPDWHGPIEKLEEEVGELKRALSKNDLQNARDECGDVLFCACNLAHFLKASPEDLLRANVEKFSRRFSYVEKCFSETGRELKGAPLSEMDAYWNAAKKSGL